MTRQEIKKKIAEIEAGIAELKEELERVENTNPDVFIPKYNEKYLMIRSDGVIFQTYWNDAVIDKDRLATGNVFRTPEEAKFEIERLKVIHELKMYAEPRDTNWDGENEFYYITYSLDNKDIQVHLKSLYKHHDIYFSSKDRAWEAIKEVGEDRVKIYYLCVEEGNI